MLVKSSCSNVLNKILRLLGETSPAVGKKKVKLSLSEEAEWEDYFLQESAKARDLKARIDATDKEIDWMVYELYGLTEEEVEMVEMG